MHHFHHTSSCSPYHVENTSAVQSVISLLSSLTCTLMQACTAMQVLAAAAAAALRTHIDNVHLSSSLAQTQPPSC
eukprot:9229-Heterococcus_DN1.PRE.1